MDNSSQNELEHLRNRGAAALDDRNRAIDALRDRVLAICLALLGLSSTAVQINNPDGLWALYTAWGILGAGVIGGMIALVLSPTLHEWRWLNTMRARYSVVVKRDKSHAEMSNIDIPSLANEERVALALRSTSEERITNTRSTIQKLIRFSGICAITGLAFLLLFTSFNLGSDLETSTGSTPTSATSTHS